MVQSSSNKLMTAQGDEEIERRSNESIEVDSNEGIAIEEEARAIDAQLPPSGNAIYIEDAHAKLADLNEQVRSLCIARRKVIAELLRAEEEALQNVYSDNVKASTTRLEQVDADLAIAHARLLTASADQVTDCNTIIASLYIDRINELSCQLGLTERRIFALANEYLRPYPGKVARSRLPTQNSAPNSNTSVPIQELYTDADDADAGPAQLLPTGQDIHFHGQKHEFNEEML